MSDGKALPNSCSGVAFPMIGRALRIAGLQRLQEKNAAAEMIGKVNEELEAAAK